VQIGAARLKAEGMDIVQITDTASYGTPKAQEETLVQLLDFGCGNGASTMTIGRLLPRTEVVGVELSPEKIEMANRIRAFRSLDNVKFLCSPSGSELPPGLGHFDFVMLSAVYEHLLPDEWKVMPRLWSALKPGGMIFINRTPYRYFPMEIHTPACGSSITCRIS
jgi:2-polyprenyl-3-methyl-5-hydroxy-6-metoxy-1,4-benzoquinol methylase